MVVRRLPNANSELYHHGIKGQEWGVKNGPPYPLDSKKEFKNVKKNSKRLFGVSNYAKKSKAVKQMANTDEIKSKRSSYDQSLKSLEDYQHNYYVKADKNERLRSIARKKIEADNKKYNWGYDKNDIEMEIDNGDYLYNLAKNELKNDPQYQKLKKDERSKYNELNKASTAAAEKILGEYKDYKISDWNGNTTEAKKFVADSIEYASGYGSKDNKKKK